MAVRAEVNSLCLSLAEKIAQGRCAVRCADDDYFAQVSLQRRVRRPRDCEAALDRRQLPPSAQMMNANVTGRLGNQPRADFDIGPVLRARISDALMHFGIE